MRVLYIFFFVLCSFLFCLSRSVCFVLCVLFSFFLYNHTVHHMITMNNKEMKKTKKKYEKNEIIKK